ncbi:MAG: hypothetical protein JKY51_07965, partial [Opitutaceae bacterium]|nr:hypothetical protein [Opitutaceae bacterium]
MSETKNPKFSEIIREEPYSIDEELLAPLLEIHQPDSLDLLEAIIEERILSKADATQAWSNSIGVAYIEPYTTIINNEALALIPLEIAQKTIILPLYIFDSVLTVAMTDTTDEALI